MDYRYYASQADCQADASAFPGTLPSGGTDVKTVTVTSGTVPDSPSVTFNSAGTFYWAAFYSGDGNNKAAVSDCSSEVLVMIGVLAPAQRVGHLLRPAGTVYRCARSSGV